MITSQDLENKIEHDELQHDDFIKILKEIEILSKTQPLAASFYLYPLSRYIYRTNDKSVIQDIMFLIDSFNLSSKDLDVQRNVLYASVVTYFILPFYPKALAAGLHLLSLGFDGDYKKEAIIYNYLGSIFDSVKLFDKAGEYNDKLFRIMRDTTEDKNKFLQYTIVYLMNSFFTAANSHNLAKAKDILEQIDEYFMTVDYDIINSCFFVMAPFFRMYYKYVKDGYINDEKYIKFVDQYIESCDSSFYIRLTTNEQLPFIKHLAFNNHLDKALEICQKIIDTTCFLGSQNDIFEVLLEIYQNKDKFDNYDQIDFVLNLCDKVVKNINTNKSLTLSTLVKEELRLYELNSNIVNMTIKFHIDELTGLKNRYSLSERWNSVEKNNPYKNLIFIDLDNLKLTNDLFGHENGDIFLQDFARILKQVCNQNCGIYRWGGDEFVILSVEPEDIVLKNLDKVTELCKNLKYPVYFSYGISEINEKTLSLKELINRADSRMYEQKNKKKLRGSRYEL